MFEVQYAPGNRERAAHRKTAEPAAVQQASDPLIHGGPLTPHEARSFIESVLGLPGGAKIGNSCATQRTPAV